MWRAERKGSKQGEYQEWFWGAALLEELCEIEQYSQSLAGRNETLKKTEVQLSLVGILVFVEILFLNSTSQTATHLKYVMDLFWDISNLQILHLLPIFSFCNNDCISNASHLFLSSNSLLELLHIIRIMHKVRVKTLRVWCRLSPLENAINLHKYTIHGLQFCHI